MQIIYDPPSPKVIFTVSQPIYRDDRFNKFPPENC